MPYSTTIQYRIFVWWMADERQQNERNWPADGLQRGISRATSTQDSDTPFTRYNRLSIRLNNRLYRVNWLWERTETDDVVIGVLRSTADIDWREAKFCPDALICILASCPSESDLCSCCPATQDDVANIRGFPDSPVRCSVQVQCRPADGACHRY